MQEGAAWIRLDPLRASALQAMADALHVSRATVMAAAVDWIFKGHYQQISAYIDKNIQKNV